MPAERFCLCVEMATESSPLQIRPEVVSKLKSVLNDQVYRDAMENSSTYNSRLINERKSRMPFLGDSYIWMNHWERMPGKTDGQLYSYPVRRWRKKRRQYLMNDNYLTRKNPQNDVPEVESGTVSTVENGNRVENGDSLDKYFDDSKEAWLREYDDGSDLPDAGELDDPESDFDDYEEYSTRKKKRKKDTPKRKRVEYSDAEKPYSCDICGARYKTRPGLSYHYSHSHQSDSGGGRGSSALEDEDVPYTPPRQLHHPSQSVPQASPLSQHSQSFGQSHPSSPHQSMQMGQSNPSGNNSKPTSGDDEGSKGSGKPLASPSQYCDFCLGDSAENKKTRSAEELVSCSDCGRSAHPTCLQFTANMVISVKKYRWQCIECKSCGLCGTSDNDDQLLFCDDCDRGYHMYCLNPPLSEPPEGSWSCHLCIEEYHTPKK